LQNSAKRVISAGMMLPKVKIIIVNYRTADLTVDCLRTLDTECPQCLCVRVTVVDGASGDGGVKQLRDVIARHGWSEWVSLMPLEQNGGFAYGNNAGIRAASTEADPPDFIMLLNPDTLVRKGALRRLVTLLTEHPRIGIVGAALEDESGLVQSAARRCPSPLSELDRGARLGVLTKLLDRWVVSMPMQDSPHPCDWVSGAAMVIRREVFEQIGLMDDGYFLYFEELDFCERARAAGWEVWHEPGSVIVHLEGASTGMGQSRRRRPGYWYASRRRFFLKRYGPLGLAAVDTCWAVGRLMLLLRRLLRLGGSTAGDPKWYMWDLLIGDLRALLRGGYPPRIRARDHGTAPQPAVSVSAPAPST
jgi:GT2 family glycosyltransferase